MKSITVTVAPGVDIPGSCRDALEQVAAATAPIRDSLARFQDHMRQVLADPRTVYEIALHRLRNAARQAVDAISSPGRAELLVADSFSDALHKVVTATEQVSRKRAIRAMFRLALRRLRDVAKRTVDALTTRQGRAYLDGDPTTDTATPETLLASLGHVRPRWHQRTTERVTCLQAPRAQLPLAAA